MYLKKDKLDTSVEKFKYSSFNYLKDKTVIDLFNEQVERVPYNLALIYNNKKITYKDLDLITTQLASYLIQNHNAQKGDFIGLMLERSDWLVVSILAILKVGAAYIPIDIEFPQSRKDYIQKDCGSRIVIDSSFIDSFTIDIEACKQNLSEEIGAKPEDIAYVIYTSGTTGEPKGVMIEHKSIVNLIVSQTQYFNIDETERILLFSNYCFDASVEQIFLALLNGATLVVVGKDVLKNHILLDFLKNNDITHLDATPSYLETLSDISQIKTLRRIVAGGEACSLKLAQKLGKVCDFYNAYGPTENTITSTIYKYSFDDNETLPIGKPICNTQAYVLSDSLELMPAGSVGELCLAGIGLARGYLNLPNLTAKKFVKNSYLKNERIYRTGDLAKILPDGNIEFISRKDNQVKIRGYRIELGEIETALNKLHSIKRAIVIARETSVNDKRLVAYIQVLEGNYDTSTNLYVEELKKSLPDYMIPSIFIKVDDFPMNSNGKVDTNNLPQVEFLRPQNLPPLKKPRTYVEKEIAKIWSSELGISQVGIDDNFFEMGGNSILTQKVSSQMKTKLNLDIPVAKIYQYPTINGISSFLNLNQNKQIKTLKKRKQIKSNDAVAIIGMACRFPGASTIEELWDVLKNGKETISFFTPEELDESIPKELRTDPLYVKARGIVPLAKEFDSRFFGINLKLAEAMDPQQRLFLEIAWEVLEQSGHLPRYYDGSIGVYAGTGNNTYYIKNVLPNTDLVNSVGLFQVDTVNDKDYIASRTSYHLNLKGPAVSVHSACSTSLLAIAEAVEAIRSGQCDVALAGGSSVTSPINSGHLYQEGSMLSANGHCRSFDAEAKGTVFSDGAGVVLLKGLQDALKDGDLIHGVIRGIGINNDGGSKGSFTAPSVEGEAGAILSAIEDSGISPAQITYIEAHGTATPVGDPIEIEGLCLAFGPQPKNGYCAIGSIKSNMGHLTAAAGVAGVIKTILALKNKKIPPSLGYEKANPVIDFENSPFYVNNKLSDWSIEGKRIAGISSFGVGGTNVHIVVEEHEAKKQISGKSRPLQILTWSAKSENSLVGYQVALGDFLKSSTNVNLADVASSLSATRDLFNKRSFILCTDVENAYNQLLSKDISSVKSSDLKIEPSNLAFLFPGQGAQYLQMGKSLYEHEDVYKKAVDKCSEILIDTLNIDIRAVIYPDNNSPEAEERLKDTQFTQPALFVVEYALSQLWMSWGIKPTLLCGHSIGEFVAAHLAGVFTLKDALLLVAVRGKLVSNLPGGSMLSVRATYDSLLEMLPDKLSVAAVNSDQLCVVSGEDDAIELFSKILEQKEIPNKLLATSHAFHSTMMDPVLEAFESEVNKVNLNIPRIPIISTVTGKWLSDSQATDPAYWTNHLRATVRFSDAMETALDLEDEIVLLEVGPGRALTTLSQQKKKSKSATAIASLVVPNKNESSYNTILSALGQLWLKGIEPNWKAFYSGETRKKLMLPAYVFDRKPCWAEPPATEIPLYNPLNITPIESNNHHPIQNQMDTILKPNRKVTILEKISEIILNTSGLELESSEYDNSFLELGLDSLVLTQLAITFKNEFNTPITFRQLNEEFSTPNFLANYLDANLPANVFAPEVSVPAATNANLPIQKNANDTLSPYQATNGITYSDSNSAMSLIAQQLQLLGKQIELLQGQGNNITSTTSQPQPIAQPESKKEVRPTVKINNEVLTEDEIKEHKKPFGASPRIEKQAAEINTEQKVFLEKLIATYNQKTAGSKNYTQKHRSHMSDPRVVSGFKPLTKELVYPLVIEKSSGNRLWDIDGNEYIDTLNGFGSCLFGYQPDFIKDVLHEQIERGFEVGPQHPLAGEVCELLCELTQHDRAALCNTGSEAVLGALRIARTVTGRSLIVAFSRSYHGIIDEVLVRGSRIKKSFPAAPGIMPESVQNMLILDYGTEESLQIIRERASELAAVLVEPIQSRRPEFQPIEFLKEVRDITKNSNTALIFDEIITGFRMHPQGMQGMYGIKADIATYGKVIGGGISIGAILGGKKYMDALDGGSWQFGDDSYPEVGVTYFAGTFVRHPLALASTKACLKYLKLQGPELQENLAHLTDRLASSLNSYFKIHNLPLKINYFRSLWQLSVLEEIPYATLIFVILRSKGIHILDGFPCYMTTAFKDEDITYIINSFIETIQELTAVGILQAHSNESLKLSYKTSSQLNQPPKSGARLGIDESGNPTWFVPDEKNEGSYEKIEL